MRHKSKGYFEVSTGIHKINTDNGTLFVEEFLIVPVQTEEEKKLYAERWRKDFLEMIDKLNLKS